MKRILTILISIPISITLTYSNPPKLNNEIVLFPNPATDYIQMNIKEYQKAEHVRIYNTECNLIDIITSVVEKNTIDLSQYNPGKYLIVIFYADGMQKASFEISAKTKF